MELVERDGKRYVSGTRTYMDGAEYYGPEEFQAEHGITFDQFGDQLVETQPEPEQQGRLYRDRKGTLQG